MYLSLSGKSILSRSTLFLLWLFSDGEVDWNYANINVKGPMQNMTLFLMYWNVKAFEFNETFKNIRPTLIKWLIVETDILDIFHRFFKSVYI